MCDREGACVRVCVCVSYWLLFTLPGSSMPYVIQKLALILVKKCSNSHDVRTGKFAASIRSIKIMTMNMNTQLNLL